jgi:hypothetical protein
MAYALTPDALVGASIKRLFGVRENELYHTQLVLNQQDTYHLGGLQRFKEHFCRHLVKTEDYNLMVREWIDQAHPKKELRLRVEKKLRATGRMYKDYRSYVDYKLKPGEFLAPGKQLRTIGEISESSAFEHGPVADSQKACFCEPFVYRGCVMQFIPGPRSESLATARDLLLSVHNRYRMAMIIYSDDSVMAVRHGGDVVYVNMDISACDASMFYPIFEFAQTVLCEADPVIADVILSSFKQCKKPIKLINRCSERPAKQGFIRVKLQYGHYCLPSGFSGTTLLNNFAQVFIFVRLADGLNRGLFRRLGLQRAIAKCAEQAGFIMKADICRGFYDVQFLKHSWSLVDGEWQPYVNLACWVRKFGYIDKQLPRGDTLEDRYLDFLSDIVVSRNNWGSTPLSAAFQARFKRRDYVSNIKLVSDEARRSEIVGGVVNLGDIYRRYDTNEAELLDLCDFIHNWELGTTICHPLIAKIMLKDYGYPGVDPQTVPPAPKLTQFSAVGHAKNRSFGRTSLYNPRKGVANHFAHPRTN